MRSQSSAAMHVSMTRFENRTHRELLREAKRPELVAYYNQPEQQERLEREIEQARRWQWPATLEFNL